MAWSVADLTSITDLLTTKLTAAVKASPLWVAQQFQFEVSGLMPASTRGDGTNVLTLYLLHVGRDPYWRNTPVQGNRGQLNQSQPLSLNLSYLLTSFSEKSWQMEQYLMSVALSYFHANPIYTSGTAEFTITVEADSIEEMSRLWQAITVPIRLSAMFRVAVVFLTEQTPPRAEARKAVEATLSVGADLNAAPPIPPAAPQLYEVEIQVAYRVTPGASDPSQVTAIPGRPALMAGQSVRVRGSALDRVDAAGVFLSPIGGGAEWPVTTWRVLGTSASGTAGDADELVLKLPQAYGATPISGTPLAATPLPGNFLLAVGNPGTAFRSNSVPLAIAPRMDNIGPGQPLLIPDGAGVYFMPASGLVNGGTQVLLDTIALTIGGAPAPGVAVVDLLIGMISWMLPFPLPPGLLSKSFVPLRLVVNGIEGPPGWWLQIP
jgi:hypothetical protein